MTKTCTVCGKAKELEHFAERKASKDGRCFKCKDCMSDYNRKYQLKNKSTLLEQHKEYSTAHREERRSYFKEYRALHKEKMDSYMKEYFQSPTGRFQQYKRCAKDKKIPFDLTLEQFIAFWKKPCICGCKINTIGLDRIDNTKGYTIDNVRPMCSYHNYMKSNYSDKEIITLASFLIP